MCFFTTFINKYTFIVVLLDCYKNNFNQKEIKRETGNQVSKWKYRSLRNFWFKCETSTSDNEVTQVRTSECLNKAELLFDHLILYFLLQALFSDLLKHNLPDQTFILLVNCTRSVLTLLSCTGSVMLGKKVNLWNNAAISDQLQFSSHLPGKEIKL